MGWIFTSMCREGVGGFKEVQQGNIILGGGGGSVTFSDLNQDFKTEKILQDIYLSTTDVGKLWTRKVNRITGTLSKYNKGLIQRKRTYLC